MSSTRAFSVSPPREPAGGSGTIALIGGGATGALVALHLARLAVAPLDVLVFEPRPVLGAGLAYSTTDPVHRVNVPAGRMSAEPDDPEHFERWALDRGIAEADPGAFAPDGALFPRRAWFGRYLAETLAEALRRSPVSLTHIRSPVTGLVPGGAGHVLTLADARQYEANAVVLASGNPPALLPPALAGLAGHPRVIGDPWRAGRLEAVGRKDRVVILGNGLSMGDAVAALAALGHRGPIRTLSRRGRLPRPTPTGAVEPQGDLADPPRRTARVLLSDFRQLARAQSWPAATEGARRAAPAIWAALPDEEKRRFLRHLRPYWETLRFGVAPQIAMAIEAGVSAGRLRIGRGRILSAEAAPDRLSLTVARARRTERLEADWLVNATGPAFSALLETPLLGALSGAGLIAPDGLGLGLLAAPDGQARGADGRPVPNLFVAGPLARGMRGELSGIREIAATTREIAAILTERLLPLRPLEILAR